MEDAKVSSVNQKTLGRHQIFPAHLKGAGLIGLSGICGSGVSVVIPKALYPLVLSLFHRDSSDYIITHGLGR
jgi:hypothetical protein